MPVLERVSLGKVIFRELNNVNSAANIKNTKRRNTTSIKGVTFISGFVFFFKNTFKTIFPVYSGWL